MVLQFLCPNGHKVHCPEDRAGQAARCPRCGVRFRIPTPEEIGLAEVVETAASSSVKAGSGSGLGAPASGVALGGASGPDQIEFLCPNDHLLHGPAGLQGRPGQFPQCGSRFRIPTYQDRPEVLPPSDAAPLVPRGSHGAASEVSVEAEQVAQESDSRLKRDSSLGARQGQAAGRTAFTPEVHPAAQLFTRLWAYKSQGATIEIRYGEGHRLTPDQFARSLSTATHGVFVVLESSGSYTVTAVPWESINVLVARGVTRLPEE